MKYFSKYIFSFFALFVIFADELFLIYASISGFRLESGMKSIMAIGIAIVGYSLLFVDLIKNRFNKNNFIQFIILSFILILYYITGIVYYPQNKNYISEFLVYGSMCIPACYVGMCLARHEYDDYVLKILPYFVVLVSLIVCSSVYRAASQGVLLGFGKEQIFNYQNASYFLAYCYSYCFFYAFLNREENKNRLLVSMMIVFMFIDAIGTLLGGGRGAFVYIIVITAYLYYRILWKDGNIKPQNLLLIIISVGVMVYLVNSLDVFDSNGFGRISRNLFKDRNRSTSYAEAIDIFKSSPVFGHGLGSVFWTIGFYSHNMLLDLLAETGFIGTLIIISAFFYMLFSLFKASYISSFDMFILLVFLGALVQSTFSGYWIASFKIFLIFGYVFGKGVNFTISNNQDVNEGKTQ